MDSPTFIALLKETHQKMLSISATKGQEYAGSEDRLANFKRLGDQLHLIPEKILWVYMTKHLDSLITYIEDQQQGKKREYSEPITGRVDDAILYLNLLKALIVEREDIAGDLGAELPVQKDTPFKDDSVDAVFCNLRGFDAAFDEGSRIPLHEAMLEKLRRSLHPKTMSGIQSSIAQWADSVFPTRTAQSSLAKLVLEEIPEFITSGMKDPLEYADLIILVLDIAHLQGIDVENAVFQKMNINRSRKWKVDPATGFMSHTRETL